MAPGNEGLDLATLHEDHSGEFEELVEKIYGGVSGRSDLPSKNGDVSSVSTNGDVSPISTNGDVYPVSTNGDVSPISTNGDVYPVSTNGDASPISTNGDASPISTNGDASPISTNGDASSVLVPAGRPAERDPDLPATSLCLPPREPVDDTYLFLDSRKSILRQLREEARDKRASRERQLLQNLTRSEHRAIETTLEILQRTESTWLVYLFKYASSKRSKELADLYQDRERSFEAQGRAWSEIWNEPKKVYITINRRMPIFLKKWLDTLLKKPTKA